MRKFWGHLAGVSPVIPRVAMVAEGVSAGAPWHWLSHITQKLLQRHETKVCIISPARKFSATFLGMVHILVD